MNDDALYLTEYQVQIIRLMVSELSTYEIANELNTTRRMLSANISTIYRKLGINNRTQLRKWALENDDEIGN